MSGLRYVLLIGFFALLAGLYLGGDPGTEASPARSAGLERARPAPLQ